MHVTRVWKAVAAGVIVLSMLASVPRAAAQVSVTVVMKSGERHVGENASLSESGEFGMRIKSGGEFKAKAAEIASVEFAPTTVAAPSLGAGQHAVVLRSGEVIGGQLIEMAHVMHDDESTDYVVRLRDQQGMARRLLADEIARVYFSSSVGARRPEVLIRQAVDQAVPASSNSA